MGSIGRATLAGLVSAALTLALGCPGSQTICGGIPATPDCSGALDSQRACVSEGGCWGVWGLAPVPSCNCPTADAGEPCSSGDDCEGHCLAAALDDGSCPDEGECSEMVGVYGCHCFVGHDDGGEMCVD